MAQTQKTRYALLGALTVFPMSGYDLKRWIKDVTGPFWAESPGRIYPALAELLHEKLVTCNVATSAGKREKKIYAITAKGKSVLKKWLIAPPSDYVARLEFKLKLFYGSNLTPSQYLKHLDWQEKKMKKILADHLAKQIHIKKDHANDPNAKFWLLSLQNAIYHDRAELAWCKEVKKNLP